MFRNIVLSKVFVYYHYREAVSGIRRLTGSYKVFSQLLLKTRLCRANRLVSVYLRRPFCVGTVVSSASAVVIAATARPGMTDTAALISAADQLYDTQQYSQVIQCLDAVKDGEDVEVLWRLVRSHYELQKLLKTDADKLASLETHFGTVQRALALNPSHPNCHKWMAIYINAISKLQGTRAQIERSMDIKNHMQKACELGPKDPTNWHMLGLWAFAVADLSWTMRKLAQVIYGDPPKATYQEALDYFLKAEEAQPGSYSMNYLMVGKCYQRLKDNDNSIKYLKLARDYDIKTTDDKEAKQESITLLKSLGVKT